MVLRTLLGITKDQPQNFNFCSITSLPITERLLRCFAVHVSSVGGSIGTAHEFSTGTCRIAFRCISRLGNHRTPHLAQPRQFTSRIIMTVSQGSLLSRISKIEIHRPLGNNTRTFRWVTEPQSVSFFGVSTSSRRLIPPTEHPSKHIHIHPLTLNLTLSLILRIGWNRDFLP